MVGLIIGVTTHSFTTLLQVKFIFAPLIKVHTNASLGVCITSILEVLLLLSCGVLAPSCSVVASEATAPTVSPTEVSNTAKDQTTIKWVPKAVRVRVAVTVKAVKVGPSVTLKATKLTTRKTENRYYRKRAKAKGAAET